MEVLCLLLLLLFNPTIQAFFITKDTRIDLKLKQGEPYDLDCVADQEIEFCKWTHKSSGQSCRIVLDENLENNNDNKLCFPTLQPKDRLRINKYYKDGKVCTLRISDAQPEDFSQWQCDLLSKLDNHQASALINVTVFSPTKLEFKTKPKRRVIAGKPFVGYGVRANRRSRAN